MIALIKSRRCILALIGLGVLCKAALLGFDVGIPVGIIVASVAIGNAIQGYKEAELQMTVYMMQYSMAQQQQPEEKKKPISLKNKEQ